MTLEQIKNLLDNYELKLAEINACDEEILSKAYIQKSHIEHAVGMIPKMRAMIDPFPDLPVPDKFHRWLGFLQGVLYCNGIYTVDEMREHNRNVTPT